MEVEVSHTLGGAGEWDIPKEREVDKRRDFVSGWGEYVCEKVSMLRFIDT